MLRRIAGPYASVLGIASFRRLLLGIGISSFGDGLSALAITWLAISMASGTERAVAVGLAVAAYSIPGAAGSLIFARLMHRLAGRQVAIIDALWRACLLLLIPLSQAFGILSLPLLLVLLALSSLLSAWGKAGRYVLLDELVPEEHTQAGNSAANVVLEGAFVAGPLVAAALLTFLDASLVIGIDALTFLSLAVVYMFGIKGPDDRLDLPRPAGRARGFSTITGSGPIFALVAVSFLLFLFSGPIDVAIPLRVVGAGEHAGYFAGYLAAFGIGGFVGALFSGYLRQRFLFSATVASVIGVGAFSLLAGVLPMGALGWIAYGLAGLCWGPFPATTTTLMQKTAGRAALSSVLAARSAVQIFALPVGALLGGPIVAAIGPQSTIVISASLILAAGIAFGLVFTVARARVATSTSTSLESTGP